MGGVSVDIFYGDVRQETSFTPAVSSLESHEEVFHEILYTCRRYVSVARRRIEEHFTRTRTRTVGTRASNAVVPGTGVPARVHLFFLLLSTQISQKKRGAAPFSAGSGKPCLRQVHGNRTEPQPRPPELCVLCLFPLQARGTPGGGMTVLTGCSPGHETRSRGGLFFLRDYDGGFRLGLT